MVATQTVLAVPRSLISAVCWLCTELVVEQASLFLLRDGTVISLFQTEGERVCKPIMDRLLVSMGTWHSACGSTMGRQY